MYFLFILHSAPRPWRTFLFKCLQVLLQKDNKTHNFDSTWIKFCILNMLQSPFWLFTTLVNPCRDSAFWLAAWRNTIYILLKIYCNLMIIWEMDICDLCICSLWCARISRRRHEVAAYCVQTSPSGVWSWCGKANHRRYSRACWMFAFHFMIISRIIAEGHTSSASLYSMLHKSSIWLKPGLDYVIAEIFITCLLLGYYLSHCLRSQ